MICKPTLSTFFTVFFCSIIIVLVLSVGEYLDLVTLGKDRCLLLSFPRTLLFFLIYFCLCIIFFAGKCAFAISQLISKPGRDYSTVCHAKDVIQHTGVLLLTVNRTWDKEI